MSRISLIVLAAMILSLAAIAYIVLVDGRNMPGPNVRPAAEVDISTDQGKTDKSIDEGGDIPLQDRTVALRESAQPDIETAPLGAARQSPLSSPGAALAHAEEQAAKTSIPVHKDFARFVDEERTEYWAENAESLILDGINFSAFGSAYSDWAVECRTTMCLTVASVDAETYNTQQFVPQGGWIDMMLTVRKDLEPVLPFANNGVSGMHLDPETGRIWMLELWWLPEP